MFDAGQGLRQGCVLAPQLLNMFFTAVLLAAEKIFLPDAAIMGSMVQLQRRKETREEKGTSRTGKVDGLGGEGGGRGGGAKLWGMLYGDDAGIVSPIIRRAREDMTVIVTACAAFGLTVSEAKTEVMGLQTMKEGGRCRSLSMQPARLTNIRSSLCTWAGPSTQTENSIYGDKAASSEGLGVLPAVRDGTL